MGTSGSQVDAVGVQAFEGCFGHLPDVDGLAVQPVALPGGVDVEAELGGYDDLVADGGERLAKEFFVGKRPVGLGGVEERDTLVGCRPDQGDAVLLAGRLAVVDAQAHAAQPQG